MGLSTAHRAMRPPWEAPQQPAHARHRQASSVDPLLTEDIQDNHAKRLKAGQYHRQLRCYDSGP